MYKYPNRPIREVYGRDKLRISEAKINKPGAAPEPDHRWLGRMFSEGAVEGTHPVRRDGAEEKGLRQALSVNFSCSKGRTCSAQLKLHQMRRICVFLEDGGGGGTWERLFTSGVPGLSLMKEGMWGMLALGLARCVSKVPGAGSLGPAWELQGRDVPAASACVPPGMHRARGQASRQTCVTPVTHDCR